MGTFLVLMFRLLCVLGAVLVAVTADPCRQLVALAAGKAVAKTWTPSRSDVEKACVKGRWLRKLYDEQQFDKHPARLQDANNPYVMAVHEVQTVDSISVLLAFHKMHPCLQTVMNQHAFGENVRFLILEQKYRQLVGGPRAELFCKIMRELIIRENPKRYEKQAPLFVNINDADRKALTTIYEKICSVPTTKVVHVASGRKEAVMQRVDFSAYGGSEEDFPVYPQGSVVQNVDLTVLTKKTFEKAANACVFLINRALPIALDKNADALRQCSSTAAEAVKGELHDYHEINSGYCHLEKRAATNAASWSALSDARRNTLVSLLKEFWYKRCLDNPKYVPEGYAPPQAPPRKKVNDIKPKGKSKASRSQELPKPPPRQAPRNRPKVVLPSKENDKPKGPPIPVPN